MSVAPPVIWITGSAGFLGTHLTRAYTAGGWRVVGLSRRPTPLATRSVQIDLSAAGAAGQLRALMDEGEAPNVVLHAAAITAGAGRTAAAYVRANALTTATLVDVLADREACRIVLVSTTSVYAPTDVNPVSETCADFSDHPYAVSKIAAERLVEGAAIPSIVVRVPSVYGEGQSDSLIDGLAAIAEAGEDLELYSNGKRVRDALYVDDVVTALQAAADVPLMDAHTVVNLGCSRPITVTEYAHALVEALGSSSAVVPLPRGATTQLALWADTRRAEELLNFAPTPLAESMARYAARRNPAS